MTDTITAHQVVHQHVHLLYFLELKHFAQLEEVGQLQVLNDTARFLGDKAAVRGHGQIVNMLSALVVSSACKGQAMAQLLQCMELWTAR